MSGPYKMLALDVDGTLISSSYTVSRRTRQALRKAMDMGMIVTLATGRFFGSAKYLARSIPVNAPIVSNDGALIKDVYSGRTLFFKPLPLELAKDILKTASRYLSFEVQVFLKDRKIFSGSDYHWVQIKRYFSFSKRYSLQGAYNYLRDFVFLPVENAGSIEELGRLLKEPPAKIVVSGEPGEVEAFKGELLENLGDRIYITSAIKNCIDVLEGSVSKARGLEVLAQHLGIKREEIIAVGDNLNDIEMLQYAGLGVAMGNAPEMVKERADFVTAGNDEDGVAFLVESILSTWKRDTIYTGVTNTLTKRT
ncbi:MAG: Cof-type HAD-IIB family hydrolase [Thermosediminibacteraceae bacterium]|nr:Cof-type HAD-IIB family hydrolase [Thermosediminibacteraceae bacterium]